MTQPSPFPFPSFPFPFPFPSLPFLHIPFPPLEVGLPQIQLGSLGERCELPQRGLGRSPSRNRIWCILAIKILTSDDNSFTYFSENQLIKFSAILQFKHFDQMLCFVGLLCCFAGQYRLHLEGNLLY